MSRRLLVSYLTITAFVLLLLEIPLGVNFQRSERAQLVSALERDARAIASFAEEALDAPTPAHIARLQSTIKQYGSDYTARVLVVDAHGTKVADSTTTDPSTDFSNRPEIQGVLRTASPVTTERHSNDLGQTLLFVAVPVAAGDRMLGAVRISYPSTNLEHRVRNNWLALGLLSAVVLGAVGIVGSVLARSVTRPVRAVERAAGALAAGDLAARAATDSGPPEVRRLAREFNDMASRLETLIGAQRAFVADASHELRTPLTALRLRLENLEFADATDVPREAEALSAEIARLGRLVEGLLALARAEGQRPERESVDLGDEIAARIEAWAALADEHHVSIVASSLPRVQVLAVRGAIAQTLDNFLANALEVTASGGTIDVALVADGDFATVHVVDEGPGLPEADRLRAFDRFWRAPGATPGKGSGLGLAIVRQLAEASGGGAALLEAHTGGIDATLRLPLDIPANQVPRPDDRPNVDIHGGSRS